MDNLVKKLKIATEINVRKYNFFNEGYIHNMIGQIYMILLNDIRCKTCSINNPGKFDIHKD